MNTVSDKIYLYGEGWTFGSAQDKGLTACPNCFADKYNMTGAGIGLFNDIIHDAAHGGYSEDSLQIREPVSSTASATTGTVIPTNNRAQSDLWTATDKLRSAFSGSGSDLERPGQPLTDDPQEAIKQLVRGRTTKRSSTRTFSNCPAASPSPTACAARTWASASSAWRRAYPSSRWARTSCARSRSIVTATIPATG